MSSEIPKDEKKRDILDVLTEMTPMDALEASMENSQPVRDFWRDDPPRPNDLPEAPPGFSWRYDRYCAGHGDYRGRWIMERDDV